MRTKSPDGIWIIDATERPFREPTHERNSGHHVNDSPWRILVLLCIPRGFGRGATAFVVEAGWQIGTVQFQVAPQRWRRWVGGRARDADAQCGWPIHRG